MSNVYLSFYLTILLLGIGCSRKFCWECTEVKEYTISITVIEEETSQNVPGSATETNSATQQSSSTSYSTRNVRFEKVYNKCDETEKEIREHEIEKSESGVVDADDDERFTYPVGTLKKTNVKCQKR